VYERSLCGVRQRFERPKVSFFLRPSRLSFSFFLSVYPSRASFFFFPRTLVKLGRLFAALTFSWTPGKAPSSSTFRLQETRDGYLFRSPRNVRTSLTWRSIHGRIYCRWSLPHSEIYTCAVLTRRMIIIYIPNIRACSCDKMTIEHVAKIWETDSCFVNYDVK